MRRTGLIILLTMAFSGAAIHFANACSNFLISKGASADGSTMITYSADSYALYGELYFWPERNWPKGSILDVYEWDTGKFLGQIPQAEHTWNVVGNMNNRQLAIGETTFGGRSELRNPDGIIDYGSLIYITLQRATNAREAIKTFSELVDNYGYYSSGESFSISDPDEVWIMELIGKGPGVKGAVWVARRLPDGYISGHANQARITTFPLADGKKSVTSKQFDLLMNPEIETIYAYDVIDVAREKGWYNGKDKDFSFSDTYAPVDFGGARFCEARVWSGFNRVTGGMDKYLDYAMGENLTNRMPLWIKPDRKLSVHDVMELMRDHYDGTPMDMTQDVGAGPYGSTVRWRPLTWTVDDVAYFNERPISTPQTGFSFVAQSRNWLPDPVGGIIWFGVDDTWYTVYTPMYCGITTVPESFRAGNGDLMNFSETSAFWIFNQVSQFAYSRTSLVDDDVKATRHKLEKGFISKSAEADLVAAEIYSVNPVAAVNYLTQFSLDAGAECTSEWKGFYHLLMTKYLDGTVRQKPEPQEGYKYLTPVIRSPGYGDDWYRLIIRETGDKFKQK
ncbi:MAG: C69 family dipeptidase [Bacteroidales bacterium]|nr:C69 family dipeptidase [Bacteroidales bacterium]